MENYQRVKQNDAERWGHIGVHEVLHSKGANPKVLQVNARAAERTRRRDAVLVASPESEPSAQVGQSLPVASGGVHMHRRSSRTSNCAHHIVMIKQWPA